MKFKSSPLKTLKVFWSFIKPNWPFFVMGTFLASLGVIIAEIIPPFIVSRAFNSLQETYATGGELRLEDFSGYIIWYTVISLLGILIWRTQVVFVWIYEVKGLKAIAEFIFDHLQKQDSGFHANRFGGSLVSQTNKFLGAFERVADEFTWSITTGLTAYIGSVIILAFVAPYFAITLVAVSLLYMAMMYWRVKKQLPLDRALATSESDRTAKLADMITNASTVRAFAAEKNENVRFERQTNSTTQKYWKLLRMHMINDTMSHVGTSLISIIAFAFGVIAITTLEAPAGTLFLAITYTMALSRRLWEFSRVLKNLNRSFGDAGDMVEILEIEPAIKDEDDAKALKVQRGDITFSNVNFAYPEQPDELLFKKLNLHIKPGEKVGLVGHSGSGKTTLSQLLLRFLDINDGEILIDGQNIAKVTQQSLRSRIAYVPQEPMMFHRSIAENISYSNPRASRRQLKAVAKMANADEFIADLSKGYDTLVGERGVKLSGGQRQRVAIARAMLKNAPILVLDEATSALDSESESLIQEALWKLMEGKTAIVIAHRLSTIQKMDRIIVLDKGKIIEQGTHKELIRQDGQYANLWNHQSGGFIED